MKRDMELVFKILEFVEASERDERKGIQIEIEGYEESQVNYHIEICVEAELLRYATTSFFDGGRSVRMVANPPFVDRLTWAGHNELSDLRRQYRDPPYFTPSVI